MSAHAPVRIAFALLLGIATTAQAQLFRAYVASDGNDANPCTLAQPCRLLPKALSVVNSGGEIWMLDSANFNTGTVTIDKSVTILAIPGAVGSIVAVNSGPAVSITASSLKVALRNVVIGPVAGGTPGTYGVNMTGGSKLLVEKSVIAGMPLSGIFATGGGTLKVVESTVRDSGQYGIHVEDGVRAVIVASRLLDNTYGVFSNTNTGSVITSASIDDSTISGGTMGVWCGATPATGAEAHVSIARTTITGANIAVNIASGPPGLALVTIASSKIVYNGQAWNNSFGYFSSLRDNIINSNGESVGTLSTLPPL
jgi:hypothetical protein